MRGKLKELLLLMPHCEIPFMRSSIIIIIIDAALWKHHSCALPLILNPRFFTITLEEPLYSLKLDEKKGMANHHHNLCWKTMLVAA